MEDQEPNPKDTAQLRARAEVLLSQARAQLADIRRALGEAAGGSALASHLTAMAAQTGAAMGQLSLALNGPAFALRETNLMALESVVHSGETSALLTEAAEQAASAARAQAVVVTAAATRQEVQNLSRDLFERKIFEAYLHFASPEDKAAYRRREAEARKYIEAQLARRTPEGNLNAGGGMMGQMLDAHAHGAGDSPDFLPRWNALVEKTLHQHAAMRAAGQSTEGFDRNLTENVRRFLKVRGLSDAEIDQRLAASENPLDAVKSFIKRDSDSRSLESKIERAAPPAASSKQLVSVEADANTAALDRPLAINPDAITARLQASGLLMADDGDVTGHGLGTRKPAAKTALEIGG